MTKMGGRDWLLPYDKDGRQSSSYGGPFGAAE
jgi:hypothetical protein